MFMAGLDEEERALFNTLRDWRTKKAHDEGVPPYLVFTNKHLVEIVTTRPDSPTALANIHGDAVSYAAMPPEGRDALLRRLGSTLYQSQRTAAAPSAAPKPWSPPAPPNPAAASGAHKLHATAALPQKA